MQAETESEFLFGTIHDSVCPIKHDSDCVCILCGWKSPNAKQRGGVSLNRLASSEAIHGDADV